MKRTFLLASLLLLCGFAAARTAGAAGRDADMNDLLGQAYKAASENKKRTALSLFTRAEDYARASKNWRGLIDIGNAYALLKSPSDALSPLRQAARISSRSNDWRGLIAAGYSLMGLRNVRNSRKYARDYFLKASRISDESSDWRGLISSGKGFFEIGDKDSALKAADKAGAIAEKNKDPEACRHVRKLYQRLGRNAKADRMAGLKKQYETLGEKDPGSGTSPEASEELEKKKRYRKYWTYFAPPFRTPDIPEWGQYHLRSFESINGKYTYKGL